MPRNQFFRRQLLPGVDIDAVAIRDAKQALRFTHNRADALISRVDQLDTGSECPACPVSPPLSLSKRLEVGYVLLRHMAGLRETVMGAWGTKVFEDDAALDFIDGQLIPLTDPRVVMREAFEATMAADYVEYDLGQAVLVSAAVMVSVRENRPIEQDEPEEWSSWRRHLATLDFSPLAELGSRACARVIGEGSELRELWEENEELFPEWRGNVVLLVERLKRPAPC